MKLALLYREQLAFLKNHLMDELDQLVATITGWANVEHDDDGRHTDITADSITVEELIVTGSTIHINLPIPLAAYLAPGSFTVQSGTYIITSSLTLSGIEVATVLGTGRWVSV